MQKSYECEVATYNGPESCGAAREGGVEALTRERAGRVFSRVRKSLRDADAVGESEGAHPAQRYREVCQSLARSETRARHSLVHSAGLLSLPCAWPRTSSRSRFQ